MGGAKGPQNLKKTVIKHCSAKTSMEESNLNYVRIIVEH
jgi:hypothetical protein